MERQFADSYTIQHLRDLRGILTVWSKVEKHISSLKMDLLAIDQD